MATKAGACPVNHTGAALIRHSFEQVAAAFDGFKSNRDHAEYTPRGGHARPNKTPRAPEPTFGNCSRLPSYDVQSTFSQPQLAYVGLCIAGLNKLARGESLISGQNGMSPLKEQIQARFLGDTGSHMRFGRSVADSAVAIFDRFGELYPNLTPAMEAMGRTGGSEGADIAVGQAHRYLEIVLNGGPEALNSEHLAPGASARRFTGQHPYYADERTHEVWCPGEAVGKSIIREAGKAALVLAETAGVRDRYDSYADAYDFVKVETDTMVAQSIQRMYAAAVLIN